MKLKQFKKNLNFFRIDISAQLNTDRRYLQNCAINMAGRGRNSDVVTIIYPPGCREVNLLKSSPYNPNCSYYQFRKDPSLH